MNKSKINNNYNQKYNKITKKNTKKKFRKNKIKNNNKKNNFTNKKNKPNNLRQISLKKYNSGGGKLKAKVRDSMARGEITKEEAEKIAKDLNVEIKDVLHMENRLSSSDAAFDSPVGGDSEDEMMSPSQYLEDKRSDPATLAEDNQVQEMNLAGLSEAIKTLDDRSKDIIQRRFLSEDKVTLHDLAAEYSISAERVRQIENGALKKSKAFMSDAA